MYIFLLCITHIFLLSNIASLTTNNNYNDRFNNQVA